MHLARISRRTATEGVPRLWASAQTYLAVDLNGERAVIAVGQSHESIDPALIEEARAIFDSIEFVRPDK